MTGRIPTAIPVLMLFLAIASARVVADHHLIDLAEDILPNDMLSRTLETSDNFYFLVNIPESGVLRAYTQGTIDTYGELMLTNETEIAVADDGGEDGNFLIESRVSAGEHLIRVAGATPFVTGPFNIITEFTGDSEPVTTRPDGPVPVSPKIRSLTGGSTDAGISAGAYATSSTPAYSNSFTTSDDISILAEIRPDTADIGSNGRLVVVRLSVTSAGVQWYLLEENGNFVDWDINDNAALLTTSAATREPLEDSNTLTIFEGQLPAGRHRMAVGYQANNGPLIYTAKAINILVQ